MLGHGHGQSLLDLPLLDKRKKFFSATRETKSSVIFRDGNMQTINVSYHGNSGHMCSSLPVRSSDIVVLLHVFLTDYSIHHYTYNMTVCSKSFFFFFSVKVPCSNRRGSPFFF